jgi:hypothetical protein
LIIAESETEAPGYKIFWIDFGLSYMSAMAEDKGIYSITLPYLSEMLLSASS